MSSELRENVLIEPSLLIDEQSLHQVIKEIPTLDTKRYQFFVPSKFSDIIQEVEPNIQNILFFRNGAKLVDLGYLKDILEKENLIRKFEITQDQKEKFGSFYESLLSNTENDILAEILFEEWIFLQERSWIISRIKKPFNYFIKSGTIGIELGRKTLDLAVKRTLKKDDTNIVTNADKLRAFAKWIAVGGQSVLPLVNPIAAVLGSAATGYFLLVDP